MKKKIFILTAFTLLSASHGFAENVLSLPISSKGDKIDYDNASNTINAEGNVEISYQGVTVLTDKARVDMTTSKAYALDDVTIQYKDMTIHGSSALYDYKNSLAVVNDFNGTSLPWYITGSSAARSGSGMIIVKKPHATTCDLPSPHYAITASEAEIRPDDRLEAKNVTFRLGGIPVFWVPYYARSLGEDTTSINLAGGYNSRFGAFVLTGYSYRLTPELDTTTHLDYRAKRGVGLGFDIENDFAWHELEGELTTYYVDDSRHEPIISPDPKDTDKSRYWLNLTQTAVIDDRTSAILTANKQSDMDVIRDFFRDDYEEGDQHETMLAVTSIQESYQLSLISTVQTDDFFTVVERLPQIKLDFYKNEIQDSGFYYSGRHSASYLNYNFSEYSASNNYDSGRTDTFNAISYPKTYAGWLTVEPFVEWEGTYYTQDVQGDNAARSIVSGGFKSNARFYKLYDNATKRHIIQPGLSYHHIDNPTIQPEELLKFDSIDYITDQNFFTPSIRNTLQERMKDGRTRTVLDTQLYTHYFPTENNDDKHSIADIFLWANYRPVETFRTSSRLSYNTYGDRVDSIYTDIAYDFSEETTASLGHRYLYNNSNFLRTRFTYRLNPQWFFSASQEYDFDEGYMYEQRYSVIKDLHCWLGELTVIDRDEDNSLGVYVIFTLKAYPSSNLKVSM